MNLAIGAASGGDAQGDTFITIENLTGSSFDDNLTGDASANLLNGGVGADTMAGGAGRDTLAGGTGLTRSSSLRISEMIPSWILAQRNDRIP